MSQFRAIEFCGASFLLSHADSNLQPRRGNIRRAQLIELQLAEVLQSPLDGPRAYLGRRRRRT
jgi:hypothetical protein